MVHSYMFLDCKPYLHKEFNTLQEALQEQSRLLGDKRLESNKVFFIQGTKELSDVTLTALAMEILNHT